MDDNASCRPRVLPRLHYRVQVISETAGAPLVEPARFAYNPALDGMRALAIIGVISGHAGVTQIAGYHGVTVFFVISGYLITSLLVDEHRRTGTIALRRFTRRRLARLGPALILVVAASVVWLVRVSEPVGTWWAGVVGSLTYTMNLIQAVDGNGAVSLYFQWSWSLAIEEQFYLVWPVLAIALLQRSRQRITLVVLVAAVASVWVIRYLQGVRGASHEFVFFGPFSHLDGLVLGAILAVLITLSPGSSALARYGRVLGPVGALGLVLVLFRGAGLPIVKTVDFDGFGQTALFAAAVILWVATTPTGWFARLLSLPPLVFIGKLSYGLYLWNVLAMLIFVRFFAVKPAASPLGLVWVVALVGVCYVSWRFVETPLRRRWATPRAHAPVVGSPQR